MIKAWVVEGADIFLRTESILFLQPDIQSYALTTDEITDEIKAETTLSADEASGQTVLSITSTTGMTNADRIGVKLDDNTIHWSTVTVDSSTQGTIATGLASAASSSNKVYAYTTKSDKPNKIQFAFRRDINDFDTEVTLVGEKEYRRQSNKKSDGPPVEVWFNPQGNQATAKLWVWPDNGGKNWDKLVLIGQVYPDDFDASSNTPDFPKEWGLALIWGLTAEIGPGYGLTIRERNLNSALAKYYLDAVLDYDVENASVILAMDEYR